MNGIRNKIWFFLNDSKVNELLSSLIVRKYQKWDLYSNVFLVITTSSSVAAWALWKNYPVLWALIIGISQVLTLTKPYFLFPKYVKVFNEKSIHWLHLTLELEELWFGINNELLDEKEAGKQYFDLRKKSLTFNNLPDDIIFFDYKKEQSLAEEESNRYITKI